MLGPEGEDPLRLHRERDGAKAKLDSVRKSLKYARRVEAKLKEGDGFLNAVLLEQAKGMEGLIDSIRTELSVIKKAIELMEQYRFEPDKAGPAIAAAVNWGTVSIKFKTI